MKDNTSTPQLMKQQGDDSPIFDRPKVTSVKIKVKAGTQKGNEYSTLITLTTTPAPTRSNIVDLQLIVKYPMSTIPDSNLTDDYADPIFSGNSICFLRNNFKHEMPIISRADVYFSRPPEPIPSVDRNVECWYEDE